MPSRPAESTHVKLFVRVDAAENLQHSSSQAYCKLYVGDTPMLDGSQKSLNKKAIAESELNEGRKSVTKDDHHGDPTAVGSPATHRIFHTSAQPTHHGETIWDETFDVFVVDPAQEILSLRIKSQHIFYCPVIASCAIYLRNLRLGEKLDQWFPLHKGKKDAGRIRLQLLLATDERVDFQHHRRVAVSADVRAVQAANHDADLAIKRLLENRERMQAERKERRKKGIQSSEDENDVASQLLARKLDEMVIGSAPGKLPSASEAVPPFQNRSPAPLTSPVLKSASLKTQLSRKTHRSSDPSLDISHNYHHSSLEHHEKESSDSDSTSSASEYEQRLDRKLRKLRKERKRLEKLKNLLKKHIPDLAFESDSSDSDSFSTSSSEGHRRKSSSKHRNKKSSHKRSSMSRRRPNSCTTIPTVTPAAPLKSTAAV